MSDLHLSFAAINFGPAATPVDFPHPPAACEYPFLALDMMFYIIYIV